MVADVLRWSGEDAALPHGTAPDALARRLAGALPDGTALHSTSWRHEDGAVVLTYALFPAPDAASAWSVLAQHIVTGPDAVHPSPECIGDRHVAAHAARHLADLGGGRDPHLTRCAQRSPHAWSLLAAHAAAVHVHPPAVAAAG